jgi:hypothetical protein
LYDLGNIMNGDIQKIVDELALVNNMEKLKKLAKFFKLVLYFFWKYHTVCSVWYIFLRMCLVKNGNNRNFVQIILKYAYFLPK